MLKTAKVPQLQYADEVVDVFAVQVVALPQVQFLRFERRCDHAATVVS